MKESACVFANAMGAVGIVHEIKELAEFDEAIDEALGALEVDVVVSGAVHDEQVAFEAFGEGDGCGGASSAITPDTDASGIDEVVLAGELLNGFSLLFWRGRRSRRRRLCATRVRVVRVCPGCRS